MPDATDIAWAAGFIDGEGCFALQKRNGKNLAETTRCPVLIVAQTRREPLDKLASMFGGTVRDAGRTLKGTKKWQWALSGKETLEPAIMLLLPYLVNKHDVAEAVLDYVKTMRRGRRVLSPLQHSIRRSIIRRFDTARSID